MTDAAFLDGLEARYGPAGTWRRFRPIRRQTVKLGRPLTPVQLAAWRR